MKTRRCFLLGAAAMAVWPVMPSLAQQPGKVYRAGFLATRPLPWLVEPLVVALRQRGWMLGRNLQLEIRTVEGDRRLAEELAKELVEQRVDIIVVVGTHMALTTRRVTASIPIVMYLSGYPVAAGLAASFARPGGNVTGLSTYGGETLFGKFMSLIAELVPSLRELGVIWDYVPPAFSEKEIEIAIGELRRAAGVLNVKFRLWMIRKETDLDEALAAIARAPVQALFATTGPVNGQPHNVARINDFAVRRRLPLMCDIASTLFRGGGLLAYSVSWKDAAERCASFVDRILRGAKPGELPIEQPTAFELVINLKTAKAIGLTIPQSMLVRADRVIE